MYKLYLYLDSPNFDLRNEYINRIKIHNYNIDQNISYSHTNSDKALNYLHELQNPHNLDYSPHLTI